MKTPLPIPLQDLRAHHAPMVDDLASAARRVIQSGRYILGPEVEGLEREVAELCGSAHGIGMSSGTDALLALLMAAGVGPGDEVVTTPFSFFATAAAAARLGARPVFADVEPDTLNLDPEKAVRAMGPRTKAVLVVHLFGRMARTNGLSAECEGAKVSLFEDAAQAIGARSGLGGPRVGHLGRAAAFSFFPAKNLGGFGDGGMVVTDDPKLASELRVLRVHGAARRYHHDQVGGNFRLDELQAALLRVGLPALGGWNDRRRGIAARYRQNLLHLERRERLRLPAEDPGCVFNQVVIRVGGGARDRLARRLGELHIETAIHYPVPLHLQACFAHLGYRPGDFPEAEAAAQDVLALPCFPELALSDVDRVCERIAEFLAG